MDLPVDPRDKRRTESGREETYTVRFKELGDFSQMEKEKERERSDAFLSFSERGRNILLFAVILPLRRGIYELYRIHKFSGKNDGEDSRALRMRKIHNNVASGQKQPRGSLSNCEILDRYSGSSIRRSYLLSLALS